MDRSIEKQPVAEPRHNSSAGDPRKNFTVFWYLYLQAHRHPLNRALHYTATSLGIISVTISMLTDLWSIAAIGISICYAMAIGAHLWIERNRSMMSTNPFFGYLADLKMCYLALTGGLSDEYDRLGLADSWKSISILKPIKITTVAPAISPDSPAQ